jgi:hypothetical protein
MTWRADKKTRLENEYHQLTRPYGAAGLVGGLGGRRNLTSLSQAFGMASGRERITWVR